MDHLHIRTIGIAAASLVRDRCMALGLTPNAAVEALLQAAVALAMNHKPDGVTDEAMLAMLVAAVTEIARLPRAPVVVA